MKTITLYRYERPEGGITISTVAPENGVEYTTKVRLIADEGKLLSKDDVTTSAIDTDTADGWAEIDDPGPEPSPDPMTETEEKAKAYDIITGVSQ